MSAPVARTVNNNPTTPLTAVLMLTGLCSIGTGVVWNGVPFIAEHDFAFSQLATMGLSFFLGVMYIAVAFTSARFLRWVQPICSARTLLVTIVLVQAVVCLGPWLVADAWMLWFVTGATSMLSALLWPVVEAYLAAGRHGRAMRHAIGWWNVVWTSSVAIALICMAPLMGEEARTARYAIIALGALNALAALAIIWFPRDPADHHEHDAQLHVGRGYPKLLAAARVLLPLSYVLLALISPLMPYRLESLEVVSTGKTPLTATWMVARVIIIIIMWRLHVWQGRGSVLLAAGIAISAGFVMIVLAPNMAMMVLGLSLFGIGQGAVYFAAIYYAMAVGRAQVDASGKHEGLIGIGYAIGPLIGMGGILLARNIDGIAAPHMIIAIAMIVIVASGWYAVHGYRKATGSGE
ncbi:MAG: MFS transporter [Phycisphaerales bacterium]